MQAGKHFTRRWTMIQTLLDLSGQAIFNIIVVLLAAVTELWPTVGDWWDGLGKKREPILMGACVFVAGAFLLACHLGVAVENCTAPAEWDDAWVAIQAALTAYGLFHAAQWFVRGGLYGARRVRAALR